MKMNLPFQKKDRRYDQRSFSRFSCFLNATFLVLFFSITNVAGQNQYPELQVGLNPSSEAWPFANALHWMTSWNKGDSWSSAHYELDEVDAYGFPIMQAGEVAYTDPSEFCPNDPNNFLSGRWVFTWEGDATVEFTHDNCTLVEGSQSEKRLVYDMAYSTDLKWELRVKITAGANYATDPIRNLKLWPPDPSDPTNKSLEPEAGEDDPIFHPLYLAKIGQDGVGVLRFMDWGHTNASNLINWSDRRPKAYCFQRGNICDNIVPGSDFDGNGDGDTDGSWQEGDIPPENQKHGAVSYEYMIELCNATNSDMWICIPHAATDNFITKLAQLINGDDPDGIGQTGLNPGLKVWVEYSNEIWGAGNTAFRQASYARQQAENEGVGHSKWVARRFCKAWNIFQSVMGGNEKMVRVAATWTADGSGYSYPFLDEIRNYGATLSPATSADVIAIATYFGQGIHAWAFENVDFSNVSEQDFQNTFDEWEERMMAGIKTSSGRDVTGEIPTKFQDYAKEFGWPLVTYEGGVGLSLTGRNCLYDGELVGTGFESPGGSDWNVTINSSTDNGRIAGALALYVDGGGTYNASDAYIVGSTPINDGNWHHVAVVLPDGASTVGDVLLYVDGNLETNSAVNSITFNTLIDNKVRVGMDTEYENILNNGYFDDVRIYNTDISATDIADLYAGSTISALPQAQWLFNDNGDDASGNGNSIHVTSGGTYSTTAYEGTHGLKSYDYIGDTFYGEADAYQGIEGTAARSVALWVKTTNTGTLVSWGKPGVVYGETAELGAVITGEGNSNYNPFIKYTFDLQRHSRIQDVYRIQNGLVKAQGLRTQAQFGDIGKFSKWGNWQIFEYLEQPEEDAPRWPFLMEWAMEEKTIREIDQPLNNGPEFYTPTELSPAVLNQPYQATIEYGGGDGTHTIQLISNEYLPAGLSVSYEENKIVISGTPTETGTFYTFYRVLDEDNDPAYRVYRIRCIERSSDPEVIIDFEDQTSTNGDPIGTYPLIIGDYSITDTKELGEIQDETYPIWNDDKWPSKVYWANKYNNYAIISRTDGGLFDLTELDVQVYQGDVVRIEADIAGGSTLTKTIRMNSQRNPMTHVVLDWISIETARVFFENKAGEGRHGAIDNIRINGTMAPKQFDQNNTLAFHAKDYDNKFLNSGHEWDTIASPAAGNDLAMVTTPNDGTAIDTLYTNDSPVLEYLINVSEPGQYFVRVRGNANGSDADDGLHIGVNSAEVSTADSITFNACSDWAWTSETASGEKASITFHTNGNYLLNIWMQDDGLMIDSVLMFMDGEAPSIPTNLVAEEVTETSISLAWDDATDNVSVDAYEVFKDGESVGTTSETSFNVVNLTAGTEYSFTVTAIDVAGNVSNESDALLANTTNSNVYSDDFSNCDVSMWSFPGGWAANHYGTPPVQCENESIRLNYKAPNSWKIPIYYTLPSAIDLTNNSDLKVLAKATLSTCFNVTLCDADGNELTNRVFAQEEVVSEFNEFVFDFSNAILAGKDLTQVAIIEFEPCGRGELYAFYIDDLEIGGNFLKNATGYCECDGDDTALSESSLNTQFKVYPNPVNDIVYIQSSLENATIEIKDISGKLVYKTKLNSNIAIVSVSNLNKGMYIVTLQSEGIYNHQELIIKK